LGNVSSIATEGELEFTSGGRGTTLRFSPNRQKRWNIGEGFFSTLLRD
jgi:hypothetical protein